MTLGGLDNYCCTPLEMTHAYLTLAADGNRISGTLDSIDGNVKSNARDDGPVPIIKIRDVMKKFPVEGDLRKEVQMSVKRLMDIGTYRGMRHKKKLPCRGQRTKTNARTKRGQRVTVGVGKKKEEEAKA